MSRRLEIQESSRNLEISAAPSLKCDEELSEKYHRPRRFEQAAAVEHSKLKVFVSLIDVFPQDYQAMNILSIERKVLRRMEKVGDVNERNE